MREEIQNLHQQTKALVQMLRLQNLQLQAQKIAHQAPKVQTAKEVSLNKKTGNQLAGFLFSKKFLTILKISSEISSMVFISSLSFKHFI